MRIVLSGRGSGSQSDESFRRKAPIRLQVNFLYPVKKILSLFLLCALCRSAKGDDTVPIDPTFTALIGGVWSATLTGLYAKPEITEKAVFKWNDTKTLILGHLIIFKDKKVYSTEDDTQWWDGKEKKLFIRGTDSEGNLKESTSWKDGDKVISAITFTKKDGSITKRNSESRFLGPDKMEVKVTWLNKDAKEMKLTIDLVRTPE